VQGWLKDETGRLGQEEKHRQQQLVAVAKRDGVTITVDGETRSLLFGYSTVNLHEKRMQELSQE
jgi:hypothetical protein